MLIVKVKICGITNYQDAVTAVAPGKAAEIINKLPAFIDTAGVFVNESVEHINETKNTCQLDWVQLHGDEDPEFCKEFLSVNVKIMKAIRVKDQADIERADSFFTDAILLDAFDPEKYGGTGLTFDWNIIGHISKRIFLAGGINPDNAAEAVELGVYGIDVCSGIEAEPGKKDHEKMKKLFENIQHLRG
jgi:phosphoribosylanthranilate isomerase